MPSGSNPTLHGGVLAAAMILSDRRPIGRVRIGLVVFEKPVDGGLEINDLTEDVTLEATLRQGGEEPLGRVEPRS
jgi:hypothetical protein